MAKEWGNKEFAVNVLGSCTAGMISRFIFHPIDTIKSRRQSGLKHYTKERQNTLLMLYRTFRSEGFLGLYRGFGAVAVGGTPGVGLYLTTYEYLKNRNDVGSLSGSHWHHLLCGMGAEATSCVFFVPVDVIKERMQITQRNPALGSVSPYTGSFDALITIVNEEGLRGLYRGYSATVFSYGPFSGLYFALYESFKSLWITHGNPKLNKTDGNIDFAPALVTSALAGGLASFVTSPLDMVKLRLQVDGMRLNANTDRIESANKAVTRGWLSGAEFFSLWTKVVRSEGYVGLFRGAGSRVMFHMPSTAVTMALFESCRSYWVSLVGNEKNN